MWKCLPFAGILDSGRTAIALSWYNLHCPNIALVADIRIRFTLTPLISTPELRSKRSTTDFFRKRKLSSRTKEIGCSHSPKSGTVAILADYRAQMIGLVGTQPPQRNLHPS